MIRTPKPSVEFWWSWHLLFSFISRVATDVHRDTKRTWHVIGVHVHWGVPDGSGVSATVQVAQKQKATSRNHNTDSWSHTRKSDSTGKYKGNADEADMRRWQRRQGSLIPAVNLMHSLIITAVKVKKQENYLTFYLYSLQQYARNHKVPCDLNSIIRESTLSSAVDTPLGLWTSL